MKPGFPARKILTYVEALQPPGWGAFSLVRGVAGIIVWLRSAVLDNASAPAYLRKVTAPGRGSGDIRSELPVAMDLSSYVTVPERIAQFREKYPDGCLRPVDEEQPYRIQEIGGKVFIVYAAAAYRAPDDIRPGIGTAWEPFPGRTPYTRDSELMNAETSAWGRAIVATLAADTQHGIATREEILNRQEDPESREKPKTARTAKTVKPLDSANLPENDDLAVFVKKAKDAKTRDELNDAWKAAGAVGRLNDTFTHDGEILTFKDFLYRRHDELAHSKSDGDADPDIRHSEGDQR